MRTLIVIVACVTLILSGVLVGLQIADEREIKERVLGCSVQVAILEGEGALAEWKTVGSGTVFKTKQGVFILTAGHVVDRAMEEVEEHPQPGEVKEDKKRIIFNDVVIIVVNEKGGRVVSEIRLYCRVLKYSPVEEQRGNDLAVLQPYDEETAAKLLSGARPLPKDSTIYTGQPVYHCGSLLGELLNSVTFGVISATARQYRGRTFFQLSTSAQPGSSGGGIFVVKDGKCYYAGMLTRGAGETINFAVPISRIRETLEKWDMAFIFDEAQ